jgi:hypothetical protein
VGSIVMHTGFATLMLVFYIVAGTCLVLMTARWWWFRAALGLYMYGRALSSLAFSDSLDRLRRVMRLHPVSGMRLMFATYALAGIAAIVGALVSLDRAPGLIVAFFALCWAWGWGWTLRQSLQSLDDGAQQPR